MELQTEIYDLYESGRYECDLEFYNKLLTLVKYLNLYEYQTKINKNIEVITKISQLTIYHSNSLSQQYDEDEALQTTKKIKLQLSKIDIESTSSALKHCKLMNNEPYTHKVKNLIEKCKDYSQEYLEITQKTWKSISSEQLRIDSLMIILLFMIKNKNNLKENIKVYGNVLEKGIQCLKVYSQKIEFMSEHPQSLKHPKSISYVQGSILIVTVLLRFYSIIKVIEGRSNVAFKLNSFKQQIQRSFKYFPTISLEIIIEDDIPIESIKKVLIGNQEQIKLINNCCKWCLRPGADSNGSHQLCLCVIRILS